MASVNLFPKATVYIAESEEQMLLSKQTKLDWAYQLLKDNEVKTTAGTTVRAIVVAGHTTGSTCYLVDGHYLFTGDI